MNLIIIILRTSTIYGTFVWGDGIEKLHIKTAPNTVLVTKTECVEFDKLQDHCQLKVTNHAIIIIIVRVSQNTGCKIDVHVHALMQYCKVIANMQVKQFQNNAMYQS